jgi:hypothetical protein
MRDIATTATIKILHGTYHFEQPAYPLGAGILGRPPRTHQLHHKERQTHLAPQTSAQGEGVSIDDETQQQLKITTCDRLTRRISSPSPVATAAPCPSLYSPAPTMGESPTRPGCLYAQPLPCVKDTA